MRKLLQEMKNPKTSMISVGVCGLHTSSVDADQVCELVTIVILAQEIQKLIRPFPPRSRVLRRMTL